MWCLGTWLGGRLGSARLTVGLVVLFQPKQFYDWFLLGSQSTLATQGTGQNTTIIFVAV